VFLAVEKIFKATVGVYLSSVGYMGGNTDNPTYEEVCKGQSNHAEVVFIHFNPDIISYLDLLEIFWNNHNPTTKNRQGLDVGTQYRSVVFFHSEEQMKIVESSLNQQSKNWKNPIVTQIISAEKFYRAEEYHQNYLNKNSLGSCGI
jgi:peptide-methionine (S)-S-oxide reductase